MKKNFIISLLIIFSSNCIYCQNWLWAKSGMGFGEGESICLDNSGNSYVTGCFMSSSIIFGTYTLTNSGGGMNNANLYIVKYDDNGNIIWAKSASGNNNIGYAITADSLGFLYVTGAFSGQQMTFNSFTLNGIGSSSNFFILKLDPLGNVIWGKSAGLNLSNFGKSIFHDSKNNVYVTGSYRSSSIIFGTDTLINKGYEDIFVVKYNSSTGNEIWAKSFGDSLIDYGNAIAVNKKGDIYITGYYISNSITFGNNHLHNVGSLTGGNGKDIYLAKLDSLGNVIWAKTIGGNYDEEAWDICIDGYDNLYFTGWFNSLAINFDNFNFYNNPGGNSFKTFIAKYNNFGNAVWVKNGRTTTSARGYAISLDNQNNIYASGGFSGVSQIIFDSDTLVSPAAQCAPYACDNLYLVKYDSTGKLLCSSVLSSGGDDESKLAIDKKGFVYITGDYMPNPFIVGNDTLIRVGNESIFTAKYSCCEKPHIITNNIVDKICKGDSINISLSGSQNYNWVSSFGTNQTTSTINETLLSNTNYTIISSYALCSDTTILSISVDDCNEPQLNIPNIFTPNGDGVNDIFFISTKNIQSLHCEIYNRWGLKVYEWDNLRGGWNGIINNKIASDGVYFYILKTENNSGINNEYKGFLNLISSQ